MARPQLQIEYGNALEGAVGSIHGLNAGDLERTEGLVRDAVLRIERERKSGQHRYRELPFDKNIVALVRAAVKRHGPGAENLVVLGIGGSALGNTALQTALSHPYHNLLSRTARGGPRLFVMDNVDPVQFRGMLEALGTSLKKTVFNVISKSGETAETASQFMVIRDLLTRKLGQKQLRKNVIVTTDATAGTMREIVDKDGYDSLSVPDGVGGRFTILSAVGLFSAAMCGIDIKALLAGAAGVDPRIADSRVRRNPAAMLAMLLYLFYAGGKRLHVMMPYSYQLKDFADWYRQLWAESLGKNRDLQGRPVAIGPTPIRALGATDQHSQVQLYREGPSDKVFIFLQVDDFGGDVKIPRASDLPESMGYLGGSTLGTLLNAEKRATESALVASQRPCITIRFPKISEETVGQFIGIMEGATSIMASLLNVNAYDQPAVQLGKEFTFALMGRKGFEKQAKEIDRAGATGRRFVV